LLKTLLKIIRKLLLFFVPVIYGLFGAMRGKKEMGLKIYANDILLLVFDEYHPIQVVTPALTTQVPQMRSTWF